MESNVLIGIVITAVVSYLIGSINFAIIISRIRRQDDVRTHGSGNAGMTNMLRTYGKGLAVLTALGDFLKALVAIVLARYIIFPYFGITTLDAGYLAGLFALIGHIYPIFFGFKGGKGVITSLGIIAAIDIQLFLVILAIALPIIFITRMVSLGSIIGAIAYPFLVVVFNKTRQKPYTFDLICGIIMAVIILFAHRENIKRLLNGTENRFEKKQK